MTTAALIIIGDEILNGRVEDVNAPRIIKLMAESGVSLRRIAFIGDDPEVIAEEVRLFAEQADIVITSGGLGPTHDDRTVEGVARAFEVPVERHPDIAAMINQYLGDRVTEAALRMADVPRGSRLLYGSDELLPLAVCGNVFMLPGVPELFEAKLPSLCDELHGEATKLRSVFLSCDESQIAALLAQVDAEHAEVKVGSYPRFEATDHRIWVTLEGHDPGRVEDALQRMLELLPDDVVVRTE